MDKSDQFKKLETSLEKVAESVSEDIGELREEIQGGFASAQQEMSDLRQEVRDGFTAVTSKIGGIHNRLDEEVDKCKMLEVRVERLERHSVTK
ncbi:hypothetical protein HY413_03875 [Candidatus Kaiserbacteria bacterium]|nr:hypothetical protein [Candidatus Kaiserbacteria bacterium]